MTAQRGQCPYCSERFVLRSDGRLRHHTGTGRWVLPDGAWAHCCPGCGQQPADETDARGVS